MKKIFKGMIIPALLLLFLVGCTNLAASEAPIGIEPPVTEQFEVLRQAVDDYLSSNPPASISAKEIYHNSFLFQNKDYLLIDIRASEDFLKGNIRGSISIPYTQTASLKKIQNLPKDKTLVIIDYNGHLSAQTAATLNMLGFNAVPLQYGIQSWTNDLAATDYDPIPEKARNYPLVNTNESSKNNTVPSLPELKMPTKTNSELIQILTATYLDRNYKGFITAEDLLADLESQSNDTNFLLDIREPEHFAQGHIQNSINISLSQLAKEESLRLLPQDKKIILIGYDGMDASFGVRALVTMGYNAVALKYGMSYWNEDTEITGAQPIQNFIQDYYELTPLNYLPPSTGPAGCG